MAKNKKISRKRALYFIVGALQSKERARYARPVYNFYQSREVDAHYAQGRAHGRYVFILLSNRGDTTKIYTQVSVSQIRHCRRAISIKEKNDTVYWKYHIKTEPQCFNDDFIRAMLPHYIYYIQALF